VDEVVDRLAGLPQGEEEATLLRACGLMARREFGAARALLERACLERPKSVAAWVVLSHCLLQEGRDPQAAEQALLAVLALEPGHAEARQNLAVLRRRTA
jgi:Flp pilus assembly protein TadD